MADTRRKNLSINALPFVLIPAALLVPALTFLTVCPPSYGPTVMRVLAWGFIASEAWGIGKLTLSINWDFNRTFDPTALFGMMAIILGAAVMVICIWGVAHG